MTRRIVILGSTGSIGTQALDVVTEAIGGEHPLRVVGLSAGSSWQQVVTQASAFDVHNIFLADAGASALARDAVDGAGVAVIHVCADIGELLDRT